MSASTPAEPEAFPSLADIKRALSPDCFRAEASTSLLYVARSVVLVLLLGWALSEARERLQSGPLLVLVTLAYVYLQGLVLWGVFTIGHDCGHGAFSSNADLNWVVGNLLHSAILVPYEAWRMSHRSHHKNTGNMDRDEIFYPGSSEREVFWTHTLGLVWFLYLITGNAPGRRDVWAFGEKEFAGQRLALGTSFASLLVVAMCIQAAALQLGWGVVALYYAAPLAVMATFLIVTTFLHHQDEDAPWYPDAEWTYVKGNLSSVDRDYGLLVNILSHYINVHQIHHLFPIIPHYKLVKATAQFKAAFPHLHRATYGSNVLAMWRGLRNWATYGASSHKAHKVFRYSDHTSK